MIFKLVLIGFGNVGQQFARLLIDKRDWLIRKKGLDVEVLAIATRSRGSLMSKRALDLERILAAIKTGSLSAYGGDSTELSPKHLIEKCDADMMVELSALNIDSGQPAIDHIRAAMGVGMDVVTANKGPIAWAYEELRDLARAKGVHFRFEGTVMDGTPVFNLVERTLPGCEVLGLTGILNSTSNFVLSEMSRGRTMDEAVREAQARGIAEADPSLDIDGWDASAKITALANVLMEAGMNPKMVDRKGIRDTGTDEVRKALTEGKKLKLVAKAFREGSALKLSVQPEIVGPDSLMWSVDGTSSMVTISTDLMGDVSIVESNPALTQTAYAVFSDMLLTVEAIRHGTI
jgi:homoserine dehydrogenase